MSSAPYSVGGKGENLTVAFIALPAFYFCLCFLPPIARQGFADLIALLKLAGGASSCESLPAAFRVDEFALCCCFALCHCASRYEPCNENAAPTESSRRRSTEREPASRCGASRSCSRRQCEPCRMWDSVREEPTMSPATASDFW